MAAERKPRRRGLKIAIIVSLLSLLVAFPFYWAITDIDREIAVLKASLGKNGVNLARSPRPTPHFPALVALGEELRRLDGAEHNPLADLEGRISTTDATFEQIKALGSLQTGEGSAGDSMSVDRVMQHCFARATLFRNTDQERALEALEVGRRLAEQLAERGEVLYLQRYGDALLECVEAWVDRPELLDRALANKPKVNPHYIIRASLEGDGHRTKALHFTLDPFSLKEQIDQRLEQKHIYRDLLRYTLEVTRAAKSRSAVDLVTSAAHPPAPLPVRVSQWAYFDQELLSDLLALASVDITYLHARAFIEISVSKVQHDHLPKREPFLDPFTGQPFEVYSTRYLFSIVSAGPDGVFDGSPRPPDNIYSTFDLERPLGRTGR